MLQVLHLKDGIGFFLKRIHVNFFCSRWQTSICIQAVKLSLIGRILGGSRAADTEVVGRLEDLVRA